MTDTSDRFYGRTVAELIEWLQQCPPDAKLRLIPAKSSGVSDPVYARLADGFQSSYGYDLPVDAGYRTDGADEYPVVWFR